MRLKTCANCQNYGDHDEEKTIDEKAYRPCHVEPPVGFQDPRGVGRFPLMPRDGWCFHHADIDPSSTATHTTADFLEFGSPVDQPT